jgi:hypothetical protein
MAQPILVFSKDPFLVSAVQLGGPNPIIQLEYPSGLAEWPSEPASVVILDTPPAHRQDAYDAIRQFYPGPLILVLGSVEDEASLAPDPARLTVKRPFGVADLVNLLNRSLPEVPPPATNASADAQTTPEPGGEGGGNGHGPAHGWADHHLNHPAGAVEGTVVTGKATIFSRRIGTAPRRAVEGVWTLSDVLGLVRGRAEGEAQPPHAASTAAEELDRSPVALAEDRRPSSPLRRTPRRGATIALLVAVCALFLVAWLALGLYGAARDARASADAVRQRLDQASTSLGAGNPAEARQAVGAARAALGDADAAANRLPVQLAAHLPVVSTPAHDLRHLLKAAHHVTQAADQTVTLQTRLLSETPGLFRGQRFNLELLSQLASQAKALESQLSGAETELRQVRGGLLEPGVHRAQESALRQVRDVKGRAQWVGAALDVLPTVLGANGARTYLVVMTNLAELRGSGGAPAAITSVRVDNGAITIAKDRLSTVGSLGDSTITWKALPEDPWHDGATSGGFARANLSPHFPTTGEELLRAYETRSGRQLQGVICLDPLAIRGFLDITDLQAIPGYGRVTAGNVARLTMLDAYARWPDRDTRRRFNQALFDALMRHFLDGRRLFAKARALGAGASERHLQAYTRDPEVQSLLDAHPLGGGLSRAEHDYVAVYTQNDNENRTDYFQRRTVRHRLRLLPDGAALATRSIRIANQTPVSGFSGTSSRLSVLTVAAYLPPGVAQVSGTVNGVPTKLAMKQEADRTFVHVDVEIPPGSAATVEVMYRIPAAAERTKRNLRYELVADAQPMVHPATLQVEVIPPAGMTILPSPPWVMRKQQATLSLPFTRRFIGHLEIVPKK